ncbi:uncharacterized protein DUF202 [Nocardioides albertanoniae]|uniref:Uncharacterized protein DUF202 n=1 Tax=Nocardioides albertanoniae TaxID=1175486 RepID=A0A543A988_9ACTN|nr:DUF202 domain-containing protein [Nocardioides albertanoniae]TQL69099.1 uncharacterized protein DUF202 [Nocardioides albertanoniae]
MSGDPPSRPGGFGRPPSAPVDRGAAAERTELAWQRTSLSVATAAAVLARLSFDRTGVAGVVVLAAASVLSLWVFAASRRRRRPIESRTTDDVAERQSGRATAFLSVAIIAMTAIELGGMLR